MSSRLREVASSCLGGLVPGIADVNVAYSSASAAPYSYWQNYGAGNTYSTIALAHSACVTGRNDVVLLTPESHSQAASITWSKNLTHLVGMSGPGLMNMRTRIGHSANFDNLLNVTGYGNVFANLYLMYGRGNAANLTCLQVTGNRNTFVSCHFAAPLHATEGDQATFKVIDFAETSGGDGLEHYFKDCVIGAETVAWTNGDMMKMSGTPRLVFENCIFLMNADNAQVTYLDGTAGDGAGFVIMKNCIGINRGTANTVVFGSTGLAAATDIILQGTNFSNATAIVAAGQEAQVLVATSPSAQAAADDPDITAAKFITTDVA